MLNLHTDNTCIRPMSDGDMHALFIGMLWTIRGIPDARRVIRKRISLLRQHRSGTHLHSLNYPRDAVMKEYPQPRISASGN